MPLDLELGTVVATGPSVISSNRPVGVHLLPAPVQAALTQLGSEQKLPVAPFQVLLQVLVQGGLVQVPPNWLR